MRVRRGLREPAIVVLRSEDHWHAIVHLGCKFVRRGGNDRKAFKGLSGGIFPAVPETGEGEGFAAREGEGVGLLDGCLRFLCGLGAVGAGRGRKLLPFIEAIGGNEATVALERAAEDGAGGDGFRTRVDGGKGEALQILREIRYEAPTHQGEFALPGVAVGAYDGLKAGWRDVIVPGGKDEISEIPGEAKGLGDTLLVGAAKISATHRIYFRRRYPSVD